MGGRDLVSMVSRLPSAASRTQCLVADQRVVSHAAAAEALRPQRPPRCHGLSHVHSSAKIRAKSRSLSPSYRELAGVDMEAASDVGGAMVLSRNGENGKCGRNSNTGVLSRGNSDSCRPSCSGNCVGGRPRARRGGRARAAPAGGGGGVAIVCSDRSEQECGTHNHKCVRL